jgi:hypothetical protein
MTMIIIQIHDACFFMNVQSPVTQRIVTLCDSSNVMGPGTVALLVYAYETDCAKL